MRYLLLSSCLCLLFACSNAYKHLQPSTTGSFTTLNKFKPQIDVALFNTQVDVIGKHLSGLLLIKNMPDSSTRIVFSNEMGYKFFDFEFSPTGDFKVYTIIKQMNKKAVIKTLRKNFELVLMQHLDTSNAYIQQDAASLRYYTFPQSKGYYHYITDSTGNTLVRMERASKRKTAVTAIMQDYVKGVPDTVGISHNKFSFTIGLKRLER